MIRDLGALESRRFDVVVVGGGIFGICVAWDAASRGLSVALIERGDFAEAASAHSFRMVHGGIRYLQHGDLPRMRESIRERRALLRLAPHLVHPLPIVIPTYGHGLQGKAALWAGMRLYDLIAADRNREIHDPDRRIPPGRILSRTECLDLFPHLERRGLTGAGVFYDGQMYNPPRLALAFLQSASQAGAVAANYVAATGFRLHHSRVCGVEARDELTGDRLTIGAKIVVNAAGGWAPSLLRHALNVRLRPGATFSRDACLIVRRTLHDRYALAALGRDRDPDAIVTRQARHLFIVPWHGYSLVGVWHVVYTGDPDAAVVTGEEADEFLSEINGACPGLNLGPDDVRCYNAGLVLVGENDPGTRDLSYGKRSRIVDHQITDGVDGLVTCLGVRWTTARGVAESVVDLAASKLRRRLPRSRTEVTPLHGGTIDSFASLLSEALRTRPADLPAEVLTNLVRNHGTEYRRVTDYCRRDPRLGQRLGRGPVIEAEALHAVHSEMAQTLADVVYRRTDLGTAEPPAPEALRACAAVMAAELGWSSWKVEDEVAHVAAAFPHPVGPSSPFQGAAEFVATRTA